VFCVVGPHVSGVRMEEEDDDDVSDHDHDRVRMKRVCWICQISIKLMMICTLYIRFFIFYFWTRLKVDIGVGPDWPTTYDHITTELGTPFNMYINSY